MDSSARNADAIFFAALEIVDPVARASFLDESCGPDEPLRGRLERLLAANPRVGQFLEPRPAEATVVHRGAPAGEAPGAIVGPYKLLEAIGEGGMGQVYMAEQARPVRRMVALKLIKPGMDSGQVVARFEAERQALALMDHPNIARVLDAGATESGRPYFVMELVRGLPITEYCDREKLSVPGRLELFVLVCRAVQHAHQKGVIHRDLKPSNILVTVIDGVAVPKVIDFGIAKATGARLTERTLFTGFHQLVGTPLYMSPEQAELSGVDVDTRSDIYSLGVLLYELLTGSTPFDEESLRRAAFDEMRRIIREEEPPRPSTRLSALGDTLATVSARRKADPRRLGASMRGELDWIAMKALEKDRRRRYETAGDFAADILRHLADQPVEACPPSASYRFAKLARRNRGALAASALVALALSAASAGVGYVASDRAALRVAGSEALARADRWASEGRRPEELEAVERAEALLAGGRGGQETLRAVRRRRADLELALRLEEIRLEIAADVKGDNFDWSPSHLAYAEAFRAYGIDVEATGPREAARKLPAGSVRGELVAALDDWARIRRSISGKDDPTWRRILAVARAADPDPWRDRLREALAEGDFKELRELQASEVRDHDHPSDVVLLSWIVMKEEVWSVVREAQRRRPDDFWLNHNLGLHLRQMTPPRPEEALGFYRAALALRPRSPGVLLNLGALLADLKRFDEAIAADREAIRLKPDYAAAHGNLGSSLHRLGRADEAIAAFREALRLDPEYFPARLNLGTALYDRGTLDEAAASAREAFRLRPHDPAALHNVGTILSKTGAVDEAEAAFREAIRRKPNKAESHNGLGALLLDRRDDPIGALASFRRSIELNPDKGETHENLGHALVAKGDIRGALAAYREAIRLEPRSAEPHCSLGMALGQQGNLDEAIAALREAIQLDPRLARAHSNLGVALGKKGRIDEAVDALRLAIELKPNDPESHYALGNMFVQKQEWGVAEGEFAEATRHRPGYAEAHCNLGQVLREQGRLREALAALRRGHKLGSEQPGWAYPSARWVEDCEALIEDSEGPTAAGPG